MISVVIPVYNVEKYIIPCLNSLLSQTFKDYELIIVNDGSSDRSMEYVENLLSNNGDVRCQIINKRNGGVSSARNTGIETASGEYIIMVDADDVVSNDFLEEYARIIEEFPNCNLYSTSFLVCSETNTDKFTSSDHKCIKISWDKAQKVFFDREIKFLLPTLLIRKDFLLANSIRFDEDVRYSEDVQFIWRCLAYNRSDIAHSFVMNYHYVLHMGSTMTSSNIDKIKTSLGGIERLFSETREYYDENIKNMLAPRMYFSILHGASRMLDSKSFSRLYEEGNCKPYIQKHASIGNIKTKSVSRILLLSRKLGYEIMKRF